MPSSLNYNKAVSVWIGRELGIKIRDMCAKYDVDPRRLYEVWEEEAHVGSKLDAMRLFGILFPKHRPAYGFASHTPLYKRTARDQLSFF